MATQISFLHGEVLARSKHATEVRAGGTKVVGGISDDTSNKHAAEGSSVGIQAVSGSPRDTSAEDDDWYEYACRII